MTPTRRTVCSGLSASLLAAPALAEAPTEARWRELEARTGGRLGVSVGPWKSPILAWRAEERFPLCSTFKVLLAAAILARVDADGERLDGVLTLREEDLLNYAPVSRQAVETGGGTGRMTVAQACAAALVWSDNTAANLLFRRVGGPAGLTQWVRSTGDSLTRSDRTEPTLNTAIPDDPRDTTSPAAMRATLARIVLDAPLTPASRERLEGWMRGSQTGFKRLRAGLPAGWQVGDKTGTGDNGTYNDVAILRPPAGRRCSPPSISPARPPRRRPARPSMRRSAV